MKISRASVPLSRRGMKVAAGALGLVVVTLLFFNLVSQWEQFRKLNVSPRLLPLAGSLILFSLGFCSLVQAWRLLLRALGFRVGFRAAFVVVIRASLGRYIPGKVWAAAGLVYLGRRAGIPVGTGSAAAVLSTLLLVLSGTLASAWRLGAFFSPGLRVLLIGGAAILLLLSVHPRLLACLVRLASRWGVAEVPPLPFSRILLCLPFYLLFWVGLGGGFVGATASLIGEVPPVPLEVASAYALAYVGGVVAVFVPGGLGVREGLLALLLGGVLVSPLPSAVSIFSRVWATGGEALLFAATFLPWFRLPAGIDETIPPVGESPAK